MKTYRVDKVRLQHNQKTGEAGTIDVCRGCSGCELKLAPCYASKGAARTGINFFQPVKRIFDGKLLRKQLENYDINWVRIGCISDPSLDWDTTCKVCKIAREQNKIPVVITKIYKSLSSQQLKSLKESNIILQISTSAFMSKRMSDTRKKTILDALDSGITTSNRINSAALKKDSKQNKLQKKLIQEAKDLKVPILETPIRLFKTSPLWNLVDETKYHRHLSPISGKLDNQRTAGLIIPKAYPCFSTCSKYPTEHDKNGCNHQCLTDI